MSSRSTYVLAVLAPAVFLLAHLLTANVYPMFRDEFYYLQCAEHLDWGYVDHPALSIALLAGWKALLGDSLFAVRLFPALCAALAAWILWKMTGALGGGLFARSLAALAAFISPQQRAIFGFYSMNAIDVVIWSAAAWLLVRILREQTPKLWIGFGLVAGLGLANKISLLYFGAGLVIALLATRERKQFAHRELWFGGGLAVLFLVPYILWQPAHDWATLEFIHNAATYKNLPLPPHQFLGMIALENNPLTALVWVPGLLALLLLRSLRDVRMLGIFAVAVLAILAAQNSKAYYTAGLMPLLLAAGGVAVENTLRLPHWKAARGALLAVLIAGGALLLPFGLRVLPVQSLAQYINQLGLTPPHTEQGMDSEVVPQTVSDCFGWAEMTDAVARVVNNLPPEQQRDCAIITGNYGETGAINYYGRQRGLPRAYSQHNSEYFWGPPPATPNTTFIIILSAQDGPGHAFDSCYVAAEHDHPWARPGERHRKIWVCRSPKFPVAELWKQGKHFM